MAQRARLPLVGSGALYDLIEADRQYQYGTGKRQMDFGYMAQDAGLKVDPKSMRPVVDASGDYILNKQNPYGQYQESSKNAANESYGLGTGFYGRQREIPQDASRYRISSAIEEGARRKLFEDEQSSYDLGAAQYGADLKAGRWGVDNQAWLTANAKKGRRYNGRTSY